MPMADRPLIYAFFMGGKMNIAIEEICREIKKLNESALCLEEYSNELPALKSNLQRIKAAIKMLELNFTEPEEYGKNA